jgi:hypothetical protein
MSKKLPLILAVLKLRQKLEINSTELFPVQFRGTEQ